MGQQQYKESEGKMTNAVGNAKDSPNELKDRVSAKFQNKDPMNVNPKATGTGSKGNPGIPT